MEAGAVYQLRQPGPPRLLESCEPNRGWTVALHSRCLQENRREGAASNTLDAHHYCLAGTAFGHTAVCWDPASVGTVGDRPVDGPQRHQAISDLSLVYNWERLVNSMLHCQSLELNSVAGLRVGNIVGRASDLDSAIDHRDLMDMTAPLFIHMPVSVQGFSPRRDQSSTEIPLRIDFRAYAEIGLP